MRNMYMAEFVDKQKLEDSANKVANDWKSPDDVLVHFHRYVDSCSAFGILAPGAEVKLDDNHRFFMRRPKEASDG